MIIESGVCKVLKDKMERTIIQKMATIAAEYVEPYDDQDRSPAVQKNSERTIKYNLYKDLLLELWDLK